MSSCALQVELLNELLQKVRGQRRIPPLFEKRFFGHAARIIAVPWLLATNSDFLYPQTRGRRPFGTRLLNWYLVHVLKLCATDRDVLLRFYRVLHFLARPAALFHPYVVFQVFKRSLGFGDKKQLSKERPRRP
jgi:hypothetical protein